MSAYRMTVHSVTGITPNVAMLGREVLKPVTLIAQPPNEPINITVLYVRSFPNAMQEAHNRIRESKLSVARTQKTYFDKNLKGPTFAVDQHVWLYWPTLVRRRIQKTHTNLDRPLENPTSHFTIGCQNSAYSSLELIRCRWCTSIVFHYVICLHHLLNQKRHHKNAIQPVCGNHHPIWHLMYSIPYTAVAFIRTILSTCFLIPSPWVVIVYMPQECRQTLMSIANWTLVLWSTTRQAVRQCLRL